MKRFVLWSAGILMATIVVIALAFYLSPWPSAFVIARAFSGGDTASETRLQKHVPADIVTRRDLAYGKGSDEVFDLNYPKAASAPLPVIVWVHGGGWIGGSKDGVANYLKMLAGQGYATVGVEYSTGPGSIYPKPVRQVNAALDYLVHHADELRIDPDRIVLAGDSAGAQIAAQLALISTDPAYAARVGITPTLPPDHLRALLLLSGAYDLDAVDYEGDQGWFLRTVLWAYSGIKDFRDDEQFRLMSITPHVTKTFPRSFISSGNGDPLEPQAVALADKLRALDVGVDTLFFPADLSPALPHEYQFNLDTPQGREALTRTIAFLEAITEETAGQGVQMAKEKELPPMPAPGSDRDAHGCIASAGYSWCVSTNQCERPWELAQKHGFKQTKEVFDAFCKNLLVQR